MTRALVVFASTHGHTKRIAARIAEVLRETGLEAQEAPIAGAPDPQAFDLVVVAGSIHGGKHHKDLVAWAREHQTTLAGTPSAFVSVSLTSAEDTDESRETAERYVDEFEEETGWAPPRVLEAAGALQYREYDFMTRLVVRLLASRHGMSTDTHEDHEFTDWADVERFARTLVPERVAAQP
jgi:menaquinone-dependent protoporphyrinogen oxidase